MRRYIAAPLTPPTIYAGAIPKGYAGTQRTIEQIGGLIRAGAKDFYLRQKAIDILLEQRVRPKDYPGEIKTLFEWVRRHVRYTRDPFRVEVLHSARRMLELRAGDCDDMTILLSAMLEAIGHPVRLVIVGPDQGRPHFFSHIYLEVFCRGRWIALDPTMPYPPGWAPRTPVKQVIELDEGPGPQAERLAPARVAPRSAPVVELGDLLGVIYRSARGQRAHIHLMRDPPRLVSNRAGTRLAIIGGSYRVTERGIEG